MSRRRVLAIAGALVLLLSLAAVVPRGSDERGALRPSDDRPSTDAAGLTRVTPAMRHEIERVVAAGRSATRPRAKSDYLTAARSVIRCAVFDGQRYCLGVGWTDRSEAEVQARAAGAARRAARVPAVPGTGDLATAAALERRTSWSPATRARAERVELVRAARSVGKVISLRSDLRTKTAADYPERSVIMKRMRTYAQTRTYWCGPTAMQTIVRGDRGRPTGSQAYWARRLRTTRSGTAISDMVRVVNKATDWDDAAHAGPYVVLDVGDWSYGQWVRLMMRHIHDYRAPVVLHPLLRKRYYPYLDDDASGHFQVGRGYDQNGRKPLLLGYFEPWDQHRFDPSEPSIARVQWRSAYRSYRANLAHDQQNLGV